MNRDEALKKVGDRLYAIGMRAAERKRHGYGNDGPSKLEMEISDLTLDLDPSGILGRALSSSCACGGREPLAVVEAETFGTTLKFPRPLTELPPQGTPVRVIVLADEPREEKV